MRDVVGIVAGGQPLPASLAAATAGLWQRTEPIRGELRSDVTIVGAGITGLSTAIALAERGVNTVVLEANEPGWGASGRNGGHVNPGLKHDPDTIERDFGEDFGRRMVRFAYGAPDRLFELIERHGIECEAVRGGTYRAAIGERHARAVRNLAAQCQRRGMPVAVHEADQMHEATGTGRYGVGLFDPRGGQVHPLRYSRGLAQTAMRLGVKLHCDSPVRSIARAANGKWELQTDQGLVLADKVLVATNGYTGPLICNLDRSILPIFSSIVASEPMPPSLAARLLARRQVLYEAGRITTYYRVDADRRLVFGGRGVMRPAEGVSTFRGLITYAERLWPDLRGVGWTNGWNGRLAMTADSYPHIHDFDDGRVACLGYNGRGVALATAIGPQLASRLLDGATSQLDLPTSEVQQIGFQPYWRVGAIPAIAWNQLLDRVGM